LFEVWEGRVGMGAKEGEIGEERVNNVGIY
jgi:hypothetical protein